jgi:hypothetical protein
MLLATGLENWQDAGRVSISAKSFASGDAFAALHGFIYVERPDAGAMAICSPRGVRLLAKNGATLPPIFDEQVRHIGLPTTTLLHETDLSRERIRKAFGRGANATLFSGRLLCLGMTCERMVFNAELFEKCAKAYVIARASGIRARAIPAWVRLIANQRLIKDERNAAKSYVSGKLPESTTAY